MFPIIHAGIFDNFCDVKGVENLFTKNLLKVVRQILLKIIAIGERLNSTFNTIAKGSVDGKLVRGTG